MVINTLNRFLYFWYYKNMGLISLFKKENRKTLFTTPSHNGKHAILLYGGGGVQCGYAGHVAADMRSDR